MRLSYSLILLFGFLASCIPTTQLVPTAFEDQYYQDLEKNIKRLHHLMQGSFVVHKEKAKKLETWNTSSGDSVIFYTRAIGNPQKEGYWLYGYEFMTSLPDAPIYSSIKQIKQISRDSFCIFYYESTEEYSLDEVLQSDFGNDWDYKSLVLRDKKVVYTRKSASNFVGHSVMYEDKQQDCLRQNTYDLSPNYYKVSFDFYDKKSKEILVDKKKRPNLLVRRKIGLKMLGKIASK